MSDWRELSEPEGLGRSPSYRDVAVDDEQLVSGNVKLAAQLVRFPVEDPEALVVRVKNGL